MSDLSWMLKPQAIRKARACIHIVEEEMGVQIKLSHPNFIQKLHQYVEQSGSRRLGIAYAELIAMAGVGNVIQNLDVKMDQVKLHSVR